MLIGLYWQVGDYLSHKVAEEEWGKGTVQQLASYIRRIEPDLKGFSPQNLWRMKQFYEAYQGSENLSPLARDLPWTHNLIILSKTKREEEREFYLRLAIQERYSKRELERQIDSGLFERSVLARPKLSPPVRQLHPSAETDYFLWALQRLYERREERFLAYLWPAFRLVQDIGDQRSARYGEYYTQKKPLTKAALDGRQ